MRVTNALGCTDYDIINVRILPATGGGFTASPLSVAPGFPVTFIDTTQNAWQGVWNFGDGSNPAIGDTVQHSYTNLGTYNARLIVTKDCYCTDTIYKTIIVDTVTGIQEILPAALEVKAFPNPAKDQLNITFSFPGQGEVSVELFNLTGTRLIQQSTQKTGVNFAETVDLNHLSQGVYFLKVSFGGLEQTMKMVKNN